MARSSSPAAKPNPGSTRTAQIELSLFDMDNDPFETTNVITDHPDVAARLQALAEQHKKQFFS